MCWVWSEANIEKTEPVVRFFYLFLNNSTLLIVYETEDGKEDDL